MESNEKNSKLNIFKGYTKVGEVGNGNNNDFIKIKNKKRINSRKDISDEICIYPSEEKVFYIRDQLYKKETKNIDYKVEEKEKEKEEKMKDVGQYHYKFMIYNSRGTIMDSLEFNCERDLTKEEAIEILGRVDVERYRFFHLYFTTCDDTRFGDVRKSNSKPGDEKFPTYS